MSEMEPTILVVEDDKNNLLSLEKIFKRDLPPGTILTEDGMMFELPAGSDEITRIDP